MQLEIRVPIMGESVSTAIVSAILVNTDTIVKAGQEIVELETDKVNQLLTAEESGKVTFNISIGDTVKVGDVIGTIDTNIIQQADQAAERIVPVSLPLAPLPVQRDIGARKGSSEFLAEFVEKKLLEEKNVTSNFSIKEEGRSRKKMSGLRKTIAARLVDAKNQTAMLTTFNEVDMSAVMGVRNKEKDSFLERYDVKLGFMSFFVKATTVALKAYPLLNSYIEGDEIVTMHSYDIGVAVSTDKGLFVPVIKRCQHKSFGEIEKEISFQAKKAREGTIAIEDLQGGTFTITNGGVFGSLLSTPILNPPQSAILGMHAIVKRAVVIEDQIVIRPMMYLALSYDHRIIDGREAVLFLKNIKETLEDPSRLLLDL